MNKATISYLAKGALAALPAVLPTHMHSGSLPHPVVAQESVAGKVVSVPDQKSVESQVIRYKTLPLPASWKEYEREFHKLAVGKAERTLTPKQSDRFDLLQYWRIQLHPRKPDEVLAQLKRDQLLEKINSVLREYVKFQRSAC